MVDALCRLCLVAGGLRIFSDITEDQKTKFESIAEMELPLTESLPSSICSDCSDQLENFFFYKKQLIRKQNELLKFLKISPAPEDFKADDDEDEEWIEELYEENGSDFEMESVEGETEEDLEADETPKAAVPLAENIEYSDQTPKIILTANFLKARETIKLNSTQEPSTSLKYLPATLITGTDNKSVFICNQCNIEFSSEVEAKLHMNDHKFSSGGQACEFCQMNFKTRHNYEKHLDSVHSNMRFVCRECGKIFESRIQHRSHIRNHNQTLKYRCTFDGCEKAFRVKHHLQNHLRVHTKDSPFECSFKECSARFRQKHALTIHLRKHTGDFFVCESCKSPFVTQFQLKRHTKICDGTYKALVTRPPRFKTAGQGSSDFSSQSEEGLKTKART